MDSAEKVREDRVRRMLARQGYRLVKSRRRDSRAYDFGTYALINPRTGEVEETPMAGSYVFDGNNLTLDQAEQWALEGVVSDPAKQARATLIAARDALQALWNADSVDGALDELMTEVAQAITDIRMRHSAEWWRDVSEDR